MAKYLCVNDIHATRRPPSSCTDLYWPDLLVLLYQTCELARQRDVDGVVWAGDVFHHKAPSRTDHGLMQELIGVVQGYPCPLWIVPGNHDMCVSDDTEALTSRGWLRREQLDGTELFATLNPETHEFEWQAPQRLFVSSYDGELVHFKGTRVDHLVTPGHDVYVAVPHGSTSRRLDGSMPPKRSVVFSPECMRKRKAADAPGIPQRWYSLSAAPVWNGKHLEHVEVPPSGRSPGLALPVRDAARLFGWYVSEGTCEPGRVVLSQSARVHAEQYEEIADLVRRTGFRPQLDPDRVRFGSAPVARFLGREFGRISREKRLPAWVKNWPRELLALLLETALKGDGARNGRSSWTYTSNSEQLVDDFQEVCVKLGVRSTKLGPIPTAHRDYPGSAGIMFRLSISYGAPVSMPVSQRVPYRGLVWCPQLTNGLWLTRRNGRVLWTGNSHDRLDSLISQPLGVLFRAGARNLESWTGADEVSKLDLYGVPWQQQWSQRRVSEVLAGWRGETYGCSLVVTHAPIYPPGQEPHYEGAEFTPASWWAEAMGNQGYLLYGHIHEPHGVWQHGGVTFCNYGALSRGSLDEYNLHRQVGVTIWDTDEPPERAFEFVPLDARPAEEVFRLRQHEEAKGGQRRLDLFLSGVDAVTLGLLNVESVIAHIREGGHPVSVVNLAEELLMAQQGGTR